MGGKKILEDSTTYQWVISKGEVKGLEKGKVEGEILGRLAEARKIVALQGTERFGQSPQAVQDALASTADIDRLERIADRMFEATDWRDLLATL
jgi:hypothetical protein